jgi:hypothetical protein
MEVGPKEACSGYILQEHVSYNRILCTTPCYEHCNTKALLYI